MKRNILIIGGMGPQASLLLHNKILKEAAKAGASGGSDFPEIHHISLPIDDFISDHTKLDAARKLIINRITHLWPYQVYA